MKHSISIGLLLLLPLPVYSEEDTKTIRVDETKFSDVYRAVWFSPSTGKITSLKERSETPPEKKYEIWIEPADPEFAYLKELKSKEGGFVRIGEGPDVFNAPEIPQEPKFNLDLTHLMKENEAKDRPVFYCRNQNSACLIMITTMDSKKQIIEFKWRLIPTKKEDPSE